MSQCLIRASEPTYTPRSWGGVGKGSHSPFQALVEAPVGGVQIPDERVGFVQGGGGGVSRVQKAGGGRDVSMGSRGQPIRASMSPGRYRAR